MYFNKFFPKISIDMNTNINNQDILVQSQCECFHLSKFVVIISVVPLIKFLQTNIQDFLNNVKANTYTYSNVQSNVKNLLGREGGRLVCCFVSKCVQVVQVVQYKFSYGEMNAHSCFWLPHTFVYVCVCVLCMYLYIYMHVSVSVYTCAY